MTHEGFKVRAEHGDGVDRSCAGGGEVRAVKPCYLVILLHLLLTCSP
jgi:hypothetical protein